MNKRREPSSPTFSSSSPEHRTAKDLSTKPGSAVEVQAVLSPAIQSPATQSPAIQSSANQWPTQQGLGSLPPSEEFCTERTSLPLPVFQTVDQWRSFHQKTSMASLGFIPTMGALHSGHGALVRQSVAENDFTLVSLFVNPTQFDEAHDLENYPTPFARDLELLKQWGCNFVFHPIAKELYPRDFQYWIHEDKDSRGLCGATRPGHFKGVMAVVLKLLNIANAHKAYFGLKDYQQYQLVKGMAEAFFVPTKIIGVPTVRDEWGLALSSRNENLKPAEKKLAREFNKVLRKNINSESKVRELENLGFGVDYLEERWGRCLGAVRIGKVRLIDNVPL